LVVVPVRDGRQWLTQDFLKRGRIRVAGARPLAGQEAELLWVRGESLRKRRFGAQTP